MKQVLNILKVIPLFILIFVNSCAEKPTEVTTLGGIEGIVYNASNGNPLSGATVTIMDIGNRITLSDGSYRFEELEEDIYTITASKSEYVTDTQSIEVVANRSKEVNFNLRAALPAQLLVTPSSLNFGELEPSLTLGVINEGDESLSWQIVSNQSWTSVFPSTGTTTEETDEVTVSVNRAGLSVGDYTGILSLSSNGGDLSVPYSMSVPFAGLIVSADTLDFGEDINSQTFSISNIGNGQLSWELTSNSSWLSVSPNNGNLTSSAETITASVNRTSLSPGDYFSSISITSNGGNKTIVVYMSVPEGPTPTLSVSASALEFGTSETQLSFSITNTGDTVLNWSVEANQSWIGLWPNNGSTNSETDVINVTVSRSGLDFGSLSGKIFISSDGGNDSINVTLDVPFEDDFTTLDGWTNDGWQISNSPNCADPPCALSYTGISVGAQTITRSVSVQDGQALSFWVYQYSPSGHVELFFNDVSVWSKNTYGSELVEVPISGTGELQIKFVGDGPEYSSIYLDNFLIE